MWHFVDFVQVAVFLFAFLEQEIIHRQTGSYLFENRKVLRTPMQFFCILLHSLFGYFCVGFAVKQRGMDM